MEQMGHTMTGSRGDGDGRGCGSMKMKMHGLRLPSEGGHARQWGLPLDLYVDRDSISKLRPYKGSRLEGRARGVPPRDAHRAHRGRYFVFLRLTLTGRDPGYSPTRTRKNAFFTASKSTGTTCVVSDPVATMPVAFGTARNGSPSDGAISIA